MLKLLRTLAGCKKQAMKQWDDEIGELVNLAIRKGIPEKRILALMQSADDHSKTRVEMYDKLKTLLLAEIA